MATKKAIMPGGVDYTKVFMILGGLCLIIFAISRVLNKSNTNRKIRPGTDGAANNQNKYVAKVDLRDRYGGQMKRRAVNIEELDETTLRLLHKDNKLTPGQVELLKNKGKLRDV